MPTNYEDKLAMNPAEIESLVGDLVSMLSDCERRVITSVYIDGAARETVATETKSTETAVYLVEYEALQKMRRVLLPLCQLRKARILVSLGDAHRVGA